MALYVLTGDVRDGTRAVRGGPRRQNCSVGFRLRRARRSASRHANPPADDSCSRDYLRFGCGRREGWGVERSTATVIFTDLVGSTELRSRLGEDAADELRRTHDRLVVEAVDANRGRLVKHLGDGIMATFTGASDALTAAVAIQQALDRHNRSGVSKVPMEVRIGASAGDVAFEEADCIGTPVIEAARLCSAAGGGQILVTEVVRLLAASAGGARVAAVAALDVKCLPAALAAYEVSW